MGGALVGRGHMPGMPAAAGAALTARLELDELRLDAARHRDSPSPPQWGGEGRDEVGETLHSPPLESPTSPSLSAPGGGEEDEHLRHLLTAATQATPAGWGLRRPSRWPPAERRRRSGAARASHATFQ